MKLFVVVCAIVTVLEAVKLPSNFKTCNRKQSNFRGCLLQAARHGISQLNRQYKEFKIPNLDPMEVPKIETSVETILLNVSSQMINCKIYKVLQLNIEKFDIDFESKTIQLSASWPEMINQCHFKTAGQIFFIDMIAEGITTFTYKNLKWTFDLTYEEVKIGNKTYVKPTSTSFDAQPEDFILEIVEIHKGNKDIAESVSQAINDNWEDIYELVRDFYLEKSREGWLQIFSEFFSELSLEEAFDN